MAPTQSRPADDPDADLPAGLSAAEVRLRADAGKRNVFVSKNARTTRQIVWDNVFTVFNVVLFSTLALTLFVSLLTSASRAAVLGDIIFSGGTVVVNIIVGTIQEVSAKRQLDRLAALNVRTSRVRRDGQTQVVNADEIVLDDLIVIEPGDRIPVDGPALVSRNFEVDESLLTGESDSVRKGVGDALLSGSFCVAGRGLMRAERVGPDSYANRLTTTAKAEKDALTPLQRKINFVVQLLVSIMFVMLVLNLVAAYNRQIPLVEALRYTTVIVTSFVPAGLVLAITVSLSVGAVKISRFNTLVQRVNAVESMGNVTVLCTDKTGTLTQNKLTVQELLPLGDFGDADARELAAQYVGASSARNNTSLAIESFVGAPNAKWALQDEIAFSSARKFGAVVLADWKLSDAPALAGVDPSGAPLRVLVGSPEILFHRGESESLRRTVDDFTREGLRVVGLGVSVGEGVGAMDDVVPAALVVIRDEIRPDIRDTMRAFAHAGVRVKVISGDSAETVRAIAGRCGIANERVATEGELAGLSGAEFDAVAHSAQLFARIVPETKRRIIQALARRGEYVAMVGDGVNDVPALKSARLGIAMNDGAQITKDVSELVLLHNTMSTLPRALVEGQHITQKIFASATLYLAKNFATILAIVLAGFVGFAFPSAPRQITWAANLTAALPAALFAFGVITPGYTHRFGSGVLGYSVVVGAIAGVTSVFAYIFSGLAGSSVIEQRTVFMLATLHIATHIYWDVADVSVFNPNDIRRHRREFFVGLGILVVGFAGPMLFPASLESVPLGALDWLIVVGVPVIGALVMRVVIYGRYFRGLIHVLEG